MEAGTLSCALWKQRAGPVKHRLQFMGCTGNFSLAFTPFEIKTVRIPVYSQLEILENDLLEREEVHRQED